MAGRKRTERDKRRRALGQNILIRSSVVEELLERIELAPDEHVVEFGVGRGALTIPLARVGARVTAVEVDAGWADHLRRLLREQGLEERVKVVCTDLRRFRLPAPPYRVVSNVPFSASTDLLRRLLRDPRRGPERADLLLQREVARKRAAQPPTTLLSAAWAPWWAFAQGPTVPRQAFRPVPRVDGAWLEIHRRQPPLLPDWLAPEFEHTLRSVWAPPPP